MPCSNSNSFPWDKGLGMECPIAKTFTPLVRLVTPGVSMVTGI